MKKYQITHPLDANHLMPTTLIKMYGSNKTFVIIGARWITVPSYINSLEDVEIIKPPLVKSESKQERNFNVTSGENIYKVDFQTNGKFRCNCPGFTYHGKCKHIQFVIDTYFKETVLTK